MAMGIVRAATTIPALPARSVPALAFVTPPSGRAGRERCDAEHRVNLPARPRTTTLLTATGADTALITGHLGLALGTRAILTPRRDAPLLLLLGASVLPDIVDVVYAIAGVCSPFGLYSHSLPAITVLAFAAGAMAIAMTGQRGVAVAVIAVVALHAPADWITGEKVLWAGGPVTDLNLYRWPWADFLLELPIVMLGWLALKRSGVGPRWATARAVVVGLIVLQAAFDTAAPFIRHLGTERRARVCGPVATPLR